MKKIMQLLQKRWLFLLLIAQPLLDVIAFWTRSEAGTVSGYIRLGIMVAIGVSVFSYAIKNRKWKTMISFLLIGSIFVMHVVNCYIHGYIGLVSDIKNVMRIAFLPILAVCFCDKICTDDLRRQAVHGILWCFVIESVVIVLAFITGTATATYSEGFGISGWVISDNRCCHSDILAAVSIFAIHYAITQKKIMFSVMIPLTVFALLYSNGTRACYMTLYAIMVGFPGFMLIKALLFRDKIGKVQWTALITMFMLLISAIVLYPVSPRKKMDEFKNASFDSREIEFVGEMESLGYDIYEMTLEEKLSDPIVHQKFIEYYETFVYGEVDILGRIYDFDRIITAYNGTISATVLGDTRDMKQIYVSFIYHDSDLMTRIFGIEFDAIGIDKVNDLENDWYAIWYYLGYYGLIVYVLLCTIIVVRIIRLVLKNFRKAITDLNFSLLIGFAIEMGLGYFSGQVFRRPNSSIYLAVIVGVIFYQTMIKEKEREEIEA